MYIVPKYPLSLSRVQTAAPRIAAAPSLQETLRLMDATKPTTRDQVRTHKVNRAFGAEYETQHEKTCSQALKTRNETHSNIHATKHSLTRANDGIIKHTHNVSGLDWTSWKADPRTVGRSSGRNDSGSWHKQSALPTTRNSVDDMSDDEFKDMMKRYVAENFGSMTKKYAGSFGSTKKWS